MGSTTTMRLSRSRAAVLGLTITLMAGLGGCSALSGADETQLVGLAMPTTTSDRWIADGDNLQKQLVSLGYRVDLEYAENDVDTQIDQIQQMLDDGASALIVGAIDGTKLKEVLAEAKAADVPVVSYDRLIRDSDAISAYATFDNDRVGVEQATTLLQGMGVLDANGDRTAAAGPWNIELVAGSADDNNAGIFYSGAMRVLQPLIDDGTLVVPSGQTDFATIATPQWDGANAVKRFDTLFGPYQAGAHLDGVLSPYDGISRALLDDIQGTLGYTPIMTGQDAELDSAKLLLSGQQYSTIYKDTRQLAEVAVQMTRSLLAGRPVEVNDTTSYDNGAGVVPAMLLAPQAVTADDVKKVLVDGGYYTAAQLGL